MSKPFFCTTLAATCVFATSIAFAIDAPSSSTIHSVDPVKPIKPMHPIHPIHSEVFDAIVAANQEFSARFAADTNIVKTLDSYAGFNYSPKTQEELRKIFGTDHPFALVRTQPAKDVINYSITLPSHSFVQTNGTHLDWDDIKIELTTNPAGSNLNSSGRWSALTISDSVGQLALRNMTLEGKQKRGVAHLWIGNAQANIESIKFELKKPNLTLAMQDLSSKTETIEHGKFIDIKYGFSVKSIHAADEQVDAFHMGLRFNKIDAKALNEAAKNIKKIARSDDASLQQQTLAMRSLLKSLGQTTIVRGLSMDIEDFSARYRGNTASLKGHIGMVGATEHDFDVPTQLLKKIVARFDINVPVALVQDISYAIARKNMRPPTNQATASPSAEQTGKNMADAMIGKLVSQGFARVDAGVLHTTIEVKNSQLSVNGKQIVLPSALGVSALGKKDTQNPQRGMTMMAPPQPPDTEAQEASRALKGDCPPIIYPAKAVREDQTGITYVRFKIEANGATSNISITHSSLWPVLDQASIDIVAACKFKPSTNGSATTDTWQERAFSWKLEDATVRPVVAPTALTPIPSSPIANPQNVPAP